MERNTQPITDATGGMKADGDAPQLDLLRNQMNTFEDACRNLKPALENALVELGKIFNDAGLVRNQSTDINTENVKVKGDLVALRYTGGNLDEIEKYIDFEFSTYEDQPYFSRERWWNDGEWVVYSKQFACIPMLEIVSNETFNSQLKHLFD